MAGDNHVLHETLKQAIERMEANLLTEFHKCAESCERLERETTDAVWAFEERLGFLEERGSDLERRRDR